MTFLVGIFLEILADRMPRPAMRYLNPDSVTPWLDLSVPLRQGY